MVVGIIRAIWRAFGNDSLYFISMFRCKRPVIFLWMFFFLFANKAQSQQPRGNDTAFYEYFPGSITARFYFSQKYTSFLLRSKTATDLRYDPNTTLNMGVGATYHNFSLNLAYGFPFLNKDENKGDTKYIDLQGHFYKPAFVIDFFGQLYKGYHLAPKGFAAAPGMDYYNRPDAKVNLFGVSAYRIFNPNRFSYRAALIQNEWQKKSAGTLLAGAEAYYGILKADSSWVPTAMTGFGDRSEVNRIHVFSIGPGIGYAYTLVARQHLFLTGSLTANLNASFTNETQTINKANRFTILPVTRYRLAAGYNGRTWNVSASWVADQVPFGSQNGTSYALQTGNYRLNVAKRLMPGPRLKKRLRIADKLFKE